MKLTINHYEKEKNLFCSLIDKEGLVAKVNCLDNNAMACHSAGVDIIGLMEYKVFKGLIDLIPRNQ